MSILIRQQEAMERRANHCVHFNGIQNKLCEAGIDYETVPRQNGHFVCFGEDPSGCVKYQAQGMAAVEKRFAEANIHYERTALARKAIVTHSEGKRGVAGRIDCPVCLKPNTLQYSIAGYNGHIHARCATENCVAWME